MTKIRKLEKLVGDLYVTLGPNHEDWAEWLGHNHVFIVADYAGDLARRKGANEDLARAGALLHDIADTKMSRFDENHENESLIMGRYLMQEAGFSDADIEITIDDAVRFHGCRDGQVPVSIEGKVLATADAKVHLLSDFYLYTAWVKGREGKSLDEVKRFILKKIERDYHDKIQFDEDRIQCLPAYEALRSLCA